MLPMWLPMPAFDGSRRRGSTHAMTLFLGCLAFAGSGMAAVYDAAPNDYRQSLKLLRAGDTLQLAAGEYREGLPVHELSGLPGHPIVISGPEQGAPATFIAQAGQNTVSIVESRHVVIRNLVLEGNNLPVDGVKAEGHSRWAHDITLENLVIRGHGNNQQNVGISTKCPAWNWVIREVTIIGAGTGMYLGNSDGNAPFVAGLIERNLVVDSIGYNLQIKHQLARPDVPGMPAERSITIIRHNVFAKPNAGRAEAARPNVLVGHFPREGRGADDDYAVYGNFFYQNRHEALFQGEGNVALYGNVFVNDYGDAVHIQPHNDVPRRIVIAFNTVLAKGAGIVVLPKDGLPGMQQEIAANAVFAGTSLAAAHANRNLQAAVDEAPSYLNRPRAPLGELDLHPKGDWTPWVPAAVVAGKALPDWDRDFDGEPRISRSIGAYVENVRHPGWTLQLERKQGGGAGKLGG
jgi:hypothetical protein